MNHLIVLIDSSSSSLTVSWPEVDKAERYVLQYRKASGGSDDDAYETLSDKLKTTQARKRNLTDETTTGFFFRAGAVIEGNDNLSELSWATHTEPFHLLSENDDKRRLATPKVSLGGSNASLLVSWESYNGATGYELQMRENSGGCEWKVLAAAFKNTEVRKKNLTSDLGYQFRVRPVFDGSSETFPFSTPSEPVVALGLSLGLKNVFKSLENGSLLRKVGEPSVPLADAIGGKTFILLYASAHWCGPCRQFTPMLTQWYQSLGPNKTVEVVFLSADHDINSFKNYYGTMPWLAVDFEDDAREELMGWIKVTGIPRLAVLDGRSGRIIEDNAVGKQLDVSRWMSLAGTK